MGMATVKRFEDLEVWALARNQCREIHELIKAGAYKEDPDLRSQMNRASASVMDTISEGFERYTRADFRHYLVMAKASNGEMRSQLHRMHDRSFIRVNHYTALVSANELLGRKLFRFIEHLTNTVIKDKSGKKSANNSVADSRVPYLTNLGDSYELPEEFILKATTSNPQPPTSNLQLPTSNLQH